MSYYHYLSTGILLLIMAISNFKDSRRKFRLEKLGIQYLDCGTGGVYGLESVDTVLWLVVQIMQYLSVPHFPPPPGISSCPQIHLVTQHLESTVMTFTVDQLEQVTL